MKKIMSFAGSNSSSSINNQLVKAAGGLVEGVTHLELKSLNVPMYSEDLEKAEGVPSDITEFFDQIQAYDAFIVATPEHNGTLPAFFKNILDWLSRYNREVFGGKPVVVLATSPGGYGGQNALGTLAAMLEHFSADVRGQFSLGSFYDNFDLENGRLKDEKKVDELSQLVTAL